MSVKYQITLPDDLAVQLKATANQLKIPLAQFIRETMEDKIRALKSSRTSADPFASITGLVSSEESDLAARIDEILYK